MKICYFQLLKVIKIIRYQVSSRTFVNNFCLYQNYYDVLKVSPKASAKEIKDAYIKLSKQFHPDLNPNDPLCHDKFVKIQNAYQALSNSKERKKYDDDLNPARKNFYHSGSPYNAPSSSYSSQWERAYERNRSEDAWVQYNEYIKQKLKDQREFKESQRKQEEYAKNFYFHNTEWLFWAVFFLVGLGMLHGSYKNLQPPSYTEFRNSNLDFYREMEKLDRSSVNYNKEVDKSVYRSTIPNSQYYNSNNSHNDQLKQEIKVSDEKYAKDPDGYSTIKNDQYKSEIKAEDIKYTNFNDNKINNSDLNKREISQ